MYRMPGDPVGLNDWHRSLNRFVPVLKTVWSSLLHCNLAACSFHGTGRGVGGSRHWSLSCLYWSRRITHASLWLVALCPSKRQASHSLASAWLVCSHLSSSVWRLVWSLYLSWIHRSSCCWSWAGFTGGGGCGVRSLGSLGPVLTTGSSRTVLPSGSKSGEIVSPRAEYSQQAYPSKTIASQSMFPLQRRAHSSGDAVPSKSTRVPVNDPSK